jgi:hypothetical protein
MPLNVIPEQSAHFNNMGPRICVWDDGNEFSYDKMSNKWHSKYLLDDIIVLN